MPILINPATEEVLDNVADDTPEDIAKKYKQARTAQKAWAHTSYTERASIVRKFRDLLETKVDELAKTLSAEMGKPVRQARNEILATRGRIDFFLEHTAALIATETVHREVPIVNVSLAETASSDTDPELKAILEAAAAGTPVPADNQGSKKTEVLAAATQISEAFHPSNETLPAQESPSGEHSPSTDPELQAVQEEDTFSPVITQTDIPIPTDLFIPPIKQEERISYEPLGVVANISAWNYPYFVGGNVFVPALLTGSAVLYKPSEYALNTGLAIANLWKEAGLPAHVFTTVVGGGAVGAALLEQPVDAVFFTGSYATGKKIAAVASQRFIPVQLELGGKDPIYVRPDVPIAKVVGGVADGAFYNTGQSCCSVERIYVHKDIFDAFVEAFVTEVKSYVIGDPSDEKTYIGPLARKEQLSFLEAQVADAVAKGAKVLCGGKRMDRKGYYFEPTVLVQVNHEMDVMREESFGPIIGIQAVASDEEAIQLMNDTRYGLTAGVYTLDQKKALALLDKLNAGSAYWNCCDRVSPRLPWSGRKDSGLGSTLSHLGIRAFLKPKAWHLNNPFLEVG